MVDPGSREGAAGDVDDRVAHFRGCLDRAGEETASVAGAKVDVFRPIRRGDLGWCPSVRGHQPRRATMMLMFSVSAKPASMASMNIFVAAYHERGLVGSSGRMGNGPRNCRHQFTSPLLARTMRRTPAARADSMT